MPSASWTRSSSSCTPRTSARSVRSRRSAAGERACGRTPMGARASCTRSPRRGSGNIPMPPAAHRGDRRGMDTVDGKYLSITSFKRDGTGVATPVWFVSENGHLLVETDEGSWKVKRIRRDPHVRIALCDARGRLRGEAVDAEARILTDDERERVERLLARKYRI